MDKYIYDESNGLWYELQGDYYIPCLTLSAEEERPIGIWGQRHKRYLKEYKNVTYTTLLISGQLYGYLADITEQAQERLETLIEQMKQAQGVTEQLKAESAFEWIGRMNNI
ncbi:TnpV protein [Dolosigranulum pigrum]|uniref:TnpV protein n=1 Tax=Dolosigranulum pigrum TaxID=29394 RepID=UPI000DC2D227|nr:TnpV protein [Dolosigranulum pigrum]QJS97534.1 TnpV protein [Dolosigranulum pigrum]QTJ35571.1 TnpV protein [Dolosigranulum pigrum]QTJ49298.1 TnpV protein [Dolosigranulum pigrum]